MTAAASLKQERPGALPGSRAPLPQPPARSV